MSPDNDVANLLVFVFIMFRANKILILVILTLKWVGVMVRIPEATQPEGS